MNSRFSKGFTLIELLVVIAIIGILSSIVLVSLNSARDKGRDASAKGSLSSVRAAAELYFDSHNSYGTAASVQLSNTSVTGNAVNAAPNICAYEDVVSLAVAVLKQTGTPPVLCQVIASPASYTVAAKLNDGQTYCVDSKGYAGYAAGAAPATAGVSCL
jgi:prepilin-type N-terminal cleavage/methylation domain-containing protein